LVDALPISRRAMVRPRWPFAALFSTIGTVVCSLPLSIVAAPEGSSNPIEEDHMSTIDDRAEAVELRDKIWMFAQRGVLALVVFFGGVFAGYQQWGEAGKLREQVEELNEKNASLVKERDTLRSKVALVERDKNQAMKQLEDTQAKAAAAAAKLEALQAPKPVAQ
jgi:hypothetical protein